MSRESRARARAEREALAELIEARIDDLAHTITWLGGILAGIWMAYALS